MYKSETITRPDGTKYIQCTRINQNEQLWSEDQERTARAIEAFAGSPFPTSPCRTVVIKKFTNEVRDYLDNINE